MVYYQNEIKMTLFILVIPHLKLHVRRYILKLVVLDKAKYIFLVTIFVCRKSNFSLEHVLVAKFRTAIISLFL